MSSPANPLSGILGNVSGLLGLGNVSGDLQAAQQQLTTAFTILIVELGVIILLLAVRER